MNAAVVGKALSTLAGSAQRAKTVPITRSNTQGGKGSGGYDMIIW